MTNPAEPDEVRNMRRDVRAVEQYIDALKAQRDAAMAINALPEDRRSWFDIGHELSTQAARIRALETQLAARERGTVSDGWQVVFADGSSSFFTHRSEATRHATTPNGAQDATIYPVYRGAALAEAS